jgi:hypothetical protein
MITHQNCKEKGRNQENEGKEKIFAFDLSRTVGMSLG